MIVDSVADGHIYTRFGTRLSMATESMPAYRLEKGEEHFKEILVKIIDKCYHFNPHKWLHLILLSS